jgi:circadian clock protein KaiB
LAAAAAGKDRAVQHPSRATPVSSTATILKLYVVSGTQSSDRAVAALQQLRADLPDDVAIEVVDVREQPEVAEAERIIATPMLVRVAPEPRRRVVGDLSDLERVRWGLGLGGGA